MRCPVCDETMREIEKHGVHIDICPACKGVWLDQGELERLISAGYGTVESDRPRTRPREAERDNGTERDHRHHDHDDHDREPRGGYGEESGGRRRRGSWLGDILGGLGGD